MMTSSHSVWPLEMLMAWWSSLSAAGSCMMPSSQPPLPRKAASVSPTWPPPASMVHRNMRTHNLGKQQGCLSRCRNSHHYDKMVTRPPYLYSVNPCNAFILRHPTALTRSYSLIDPCYGVKKLGQCWNR